MREIVIFLIDGSREIRILSPWFRIFLKDDYLTFREIHVIVQCLQYCKFLAASNTWSEKKVWKSCFLLLLRASDAKIGWTLLKPRFQDRKRLLWSRTTGFRHECEHSRPEIMSLVHAKCAHMSDFGILFEKKLSENVIWMLSEYLHGPYSWKTYSF